MRVKYKELVELRFKLYSRTTRSMTWNHWIVINQNDSYYLVRFSLRSLINMEKVLQNTELNGNTLIANPFCNLVVLVYQPEANKHIEMYASDTKVRKKKENILSGKHEVTRWHFFIFLSWLKFTTLPKVFASLKWCKIFTYSVLLCFWWYRRAWLLSPTAQWVFNYQQNWLLDQTTRLCFPCLHLLKLTG